MNKFLRWIFTLWTFSRSGLVYVSFPISVLDTALLINGFYPARFLIVAVIGGPAVLIATILFGYMHFHKKPYARDTEIGVENSPYTFKAQPGLGLDLQIPTQIIVLRTMRKLADKEDVPLYDLLLRRWQEVGRGRDLREIKGEELPETQKQVEGLVYE